MKIFVTGASGFIGGAIVRQLAINPSWSVLATGRSTPNPFPDQPQVSYFQADLSADFGAVSCDVCIHCAGLADDRSTWDQYWRNNVQATRQLIQSLEGCRTFIFISSSSVYDFSDQQPKVEEDAKQSEGLSFYGRSKLEAEKVVCESGIRSIYILRPRAVYGPGDRVLLPRLLAMMNKYLIIAPGSLHVNTSLTHIQTLVHVVEEAMIKSTPGCHIYNIADPEVYHIKKVIAQIAFQYHGHQRFIHLPLCLIRLASKILSIAGKPPIMSTQAIEYVSKHSVLSTRKLERLR